MGNLRNPRLRTGGCEDLCSFKTSTKCIGKYTIHGWYGFEIFLPNGDLAAIKNFHGRMRKNRPQINPCIVSRLKSNHFTKNII